jgi:GNAT superfamily N-acetyltransferase
VAARATRRYNGAVRIEPFDPRTADEAVARAYTDFLRAHTREQWPSGLVAPAEYVLNRLRNTSGRHRVFLWLAWDGPSLVGAGELTWWEAEDNRDRAWFHPAVAPGRDVAPVLAALFAAAEEHVRPLGRTMLNVETVHGDAVGRWVTGRGGTLGSVEQLNVVRLRSVSRDDVAALAAPPAGYELVAFDGDCPDDLLERYTRLMDTMNTAPRDDLTMDDWVYTPDRVRDYEAGLRARGHTMWTVLARAVDTGELAAFNQLVRLPEWPEVIENEDTAVAVPHRGHGLGLCVKAVNLLRALDSGAEAIVTWNAASNEHMLRVNRRLGFVCEHEWDSWELRLP